MKKIFASLGILVFSLTSSATLTVHVDAASFEAYSGDYGYDQFNDMTCLDITPSPLLRTAAPYTYAASSANNFYNSCITPGTSLSANDANSPIVIDQFTGDVSAVGANFFVTDITGTFITGGQLTLTATDSTGATLDYTIEANSPMAFAGFTSDATITSISIQSVQPSPDVFHWTTLNTLVLGKSH